MFMWPHLGLDEDRHVQEYLVQLKKALLKVLDCPVALLNLCQNVQSAASALKRGGRGEMGQI